MSKATLLVALSVALAGAGAAWGYHSFQQQINSSILIERYSRELTLTHARSGSYPTSFDQRDWWGRPVGYHQTADHFIVISYGSDGKPDRPDYADLIGNANPSALANSCLLTTRDTVFVDGKAWQACLK